MICLFLIKSLPMSTLFFSLRKRFDFSGKTFDIGNWLTWDKEQLTRFVFHKIFQIGAARFPDFYHYHLKYYRSSQPDSDERSFHKYLWDLLSEDLLRLQHISVFSKKNVRNIRMKEILKSNLAFLESIDRWNHGETAEATIARLQIQITNQENKIKELSSALKEARNLETDDYINIADGYLHSLLDLMLQLQEITLPDGRELVFSQTQAAWMKMICKHFKEADQPVKLNSIARYFPADKRDPGVKHAPIKEKFKLFIIRPKR